MGQGPMRGSPCSGALKGREARPCQVGGILAIQPKIGRMHARHHQLPRSRAEKNAIVYNYSLVKEHGITESGLERRQSKFGPTERQLTRNQ